MKGIVRGNTDRTGWVDETVLDQSSDDHSVGHGNDMSPEPDNGQGQPDGAVYDWYHRGMRLLDGGDAAAAAQVLSHAAQAEPGSRSIREALARALFDAGQYSQARDGFHDLL